jgi:hypothetical protein
MQNGDSFIQFLRNVDQNGAEKKKRRTKTIAIAILRPSALNAGL